MLFGVGLMSVLGLAFTIQTGNPYWLFLSLPFTLLLLAIGRFAPSAYRLGAQSIDVERRAGPARIAYRAIRGVDREARTVNGLTLLGSRGIFGRFGLFWNTRLGWFTLYLTNTDNVVWLHTARGLVALSPDRPDEFVERLRGRLGR